MVHFRDRQQAGERLAEKLLAYENHPDCVVVGLPRGGVVTAAAVAKRLGLSLDIVCPRKIGAPSNPEYAIGAITETGEGFFDHHAIARLGVSSAYLRNETEKEKEEALRRLEVYRSTRPPADFADKTVILVDDGIATGATMKAAIQSVKRRHASHLVVAVPVIPPDSIDDIQEEVDELIYLDAPPYFMAVGQFYENFEATTDAEVIHLLR